MTDTSDGKRDFFVSFNQIDRTWASWIAWTLEAAGYSVFFQDWDFKGNFVLEMDRAHARSRRTIAVLSPDYLASRFIAPEWAAQKSMRSLWSVQAFLWLRLAATTWPPGKA